MRWGIWAVAAVALAGCASETDRNYADFKACQAQGYQPGSPAYWQCRNGAEADRALRRQAVAASLVQMGQTLRDTSAPPEASPPALAAFPDTAMPQAIQSGQTQVCLYETGRGPVAVSTRAGSVCRVAPPH